jgi:hypothetical protein
VPRCAQAADKAQRKDRKEREEREREARRKLEREAEESDKRRRKAAAADAAANFQTLLSEVVKDPEASWHEWRPRLSRDPQVGILGFSPLTALKSRSNHLLGVLDEQRVADKRVVGPPKWPGLMSSRCNPTDVIIPGACRAYRGGSATLIWTLRRPRCCSAST